MVNIMLGETQKKIIRLGISLVQKKIKKCVTQKNIKEDMYNCGNQVFAELAQLLLKTADLIKSPYGQKEVLSEVALFELWVAYKDTAYNPIVAYMINEIIQNADHWKKIVKPYLVPPEDWYVNQWIEAKKQSDKLRKDGKIPKYGKALSESVFTPSEQSQRIHKMK